MKTEVLDKITAFCFVFITVIMKFLNAQSLELSSAQLTTEKVNVWFFKAFGDSVYFRNSIG